MPHHARNVADVDNEFRTLMDQQLPEQRYQQYLEENPVLIPREFIQNHGLHFKLVLRKLALARDYTTDFFYLAKSSADWNCVLVEIEKPCSRYFRDGTNDLHADFVAALSQIARWRAWFAERANFEGFVNGTVRMLRIPQAMAPNPCHIKYVLVMGRRSEFAANDDRRRLITAWESHDFHILSYDSLLEDLHSKCDLYIGSRHNDHIELLSSTFAGEDLFSWMPPEQLRIRQALKDDIEHHRNEWYTHTVGGGLALDAALPNIRLAPQP